jgi:tRNA threonylcarbamoyl adenosine modification protein YeaZ
VATIAVIEDDVMIAEYTICYKKTHSQTLLPMLEEIKKMTDLDLKTIDAIAITKGPGSFTGLRIGCASAKGLGLALDCPLVPVPTVDSLAYNMYGSSALICPLMDARREQVYTGLYRFEKKEVKLEDVVFSKKWKVYATDQIEARYLLTTAFMERILEVKRRFKGKDIEFSFFDNKLFIAVHTSKDLFETTSLFKSALSYHRMQNVVYQFYSVFSIIDLLKIKGTEENEKT